MNYKYISNNEQDTKILAQNIEANKFNNMVICLNGDLGSGKTLFSKAFAHAMGIKDTVTSPTFTLIKEYYDGDIPLYHMDLYRVEENCEFEIQDYINEEAICLIEWSNMHQNYMPKSRLEIEFKILAENKREINLTPYGEEYVNLCEVSL